MYGAFLMVCAVAATSCSKDAVADEDLQCTIVEADEETTTVACSDGTSVVIDNEHSDLVSSDLSLYVATTGSDQSGDGSLANPWATPHAAFDHLANKRISSNAIVTINIAAGIYELPSAIQIWHPDGARIQLHGAPMLDNKPAGVATLGDGQTELAQFAWISRPPNPQVLDVNPLSYPGDASVVNSSAWLDEQLDRARRRNGDLIMRSYATVFRFTGGSNGVELMGNGQLGWCNNIAFLGNYDLETGALIPPPRYDSGNGIVSRVIDGSVVSGTLGGVGTLRFGPNTAVHGWYGYGINSNQGASFIFADEVTVTNCGGTGIGINDGEGSFNGATIVNNYLHGISTYGGGTISCHGCQIVGSVNGIGVYAAYFSNIFCDNSTIVGNNIGISSYYTSFVRARACIIDGNNLGLSAAYGGNVENYGTIKDSRSTGVMALRGSSVSSSATITGSGGLGIYATGGYVTWGGTLANNNSGIREISVLDGGSAYSSPPDVLIAGDGTGATAQATIEGGAIKAVKIMDPGHGYTAATVSFSEGNAIASADVSNGHELRAAMDGVIEFTWGTTSPDIDSHNGTTDTGGQIIAQDIP